MYKQTDLLQKGLSAAWTRNAVIRHNIANVETPGFKASNVEFETLLAQAIEDTGYGFRGAATHEWHIDNKGFIGSKTHPMHLDIGSGIMDRIDSIEPRLVKRDNVSMRMDGNNVDIEDENVKLAQNSIYYNALLEKMNSEFRRLRLAITESK